MRDKNTIKFAICALLLVFTTSVFAQGFPGDKIIPGAERPQAYLPLLQGKRIAVVANQTSLVGVEHLVDFLLEKGVKIKKILAPEHGFRDMAAAGELIKNGFDSKTKLPVVSLYGKNKKPTAQQLSDIDIIVFDIQDVGCRFYTYISTLTYLMEAAAENGKRVIVLDRPNPNGYYIDGPVMEDDCKSFVGMHPVPIVYGMTIGEYASMVNMEGWLAGGVICDLHIVPCDNYTHADRYELPVTPSPNLPNGRAINLFPSLCFFEGTPLSEGRGTDYPFQLFGSDLLPYTGFTFTPLMGKDGAATPKLSGVQCNGFDLRHAPEYRDINLQWLLWAYSHYSDPDHFFTPYFKNLAGTTQLRHQIEQGLTEHQIKESWQPGIRGFKKIRAKYLLYPETRDVESEPAHKD